MSSNTVIQIGKRCSMLDQVKKTFDGSADPQNARPKAGDFAQPSTSPHGISVLKGVSRLGRLFAMQRSPLRERSSLLPRRRLLGEIGR